jgi:hypothetical protein
MPYIRPSTALFAICRSGSGFWIAGLPVSCRATTAYTSSEPLKISKKRVSPLMAAAMRASTCA